MNKQLEIDLLAGVDAILGNTGLITKRGFHFQPEQYQYACSVARGFARGMEEMASMTLLEAATGTGKTIGYGVPLALYAAITDSRVSISTYTLHLQRQIMEKDMPAILGMVSEYTGTELSAARRVGIRNFVSYSRLLDVANDIPKTEDEGEWNTLNDLLKFAKDSTRKKSASTGEIAQFIEDNGLIKLPFDLAVDQICLSSGCPENEMEAFNTHCNEAKSADIVVTSHAMTILHTRNTFSILDEDKPISIMVFDEADKFPEVAQSILSQRFPVVRVRAMLEKIDHPEFVQCAQSAKKLEATIKQLREDNGGLNFIPEATSHKNLNTALLKFAKDLRQVMKFATSASKVEKTKDGNTNIFVIDKVVKEHLADLAGYSMRLTELSNQFKTGKAQSPTMAVNISFSPSRNFPTISVIPTNPGYALSKLWLPRKDEDGESSLYLKACLMTSASLGDPGRDKIADRFTQFMFECGIFAQARLKKESQKRTQVLQINEDLFQSFEPLMFGKMVFFLADPRLPKPLMNNQEVESDDEFEENYNFQKIANPEWLRYVANAVVYASSNFSGRTLVLTNSHRDTELIAALLESLPDAIKPKNVVAHYRNTRLSDAVELFKRESNSILVSAGAWEGLSLVSNETGKGMISNLVITRLPYGGKDGIKAKVFEDALRIKGKSPEEIRGYMHALYVSAARRKLLQGLGRPIRTRADSCRVFITDPRFPLIDGVKSKAEFGASKVRTQASFHHCVPKRFFPSLRNAKIIRMDGSIFDPKS